LSLVWFRCPEPVLPAGQERSYVDIEWLVKIKTDSLGSVHYEAWSQPHGERTVLTKPKILCVPIVWQRVEVSLLVSKVGK